MALPPAPRFTLLTIPLVLALFLAGCAGPAEDDTDTDGSEADSAEVIQLKARIAELEAELEEEEPAALPDVAHGEALDPATGLLVKHLGDGLYWMTEGAYQVVFLTTGVGVIVIDAPPSFGDRIVQTIENTTNEPITHVIYTHGHADHIAGASRYPAGATYIAHQATADTLAEIMADTERPVPFGTFVGGSPVPLPTVTFESSYTLTVGNQTLELSELGPAHEAGNLFIWAAKQKVLTVIDVFFPGWVPFLHLALAEDVPAYVAAHDQALGYPFEHIAAGHLGRLGTRADIETAKEYVLDLQANAITALQTVDFMAIAAETGFENAWHLFGTYLDALATECARLTEAEWVGKLGGADLFTHSHCFAMVESLRID